MTDYDWSIGTAGTMRIRVLSTTVEFWITANNNTTYNHALPWGYTVNGVTNNSRTYDYNAGAYWERLGVWTVTTSQTVTFRLFDTGTSGLGSGETHSVYVSRGPAATVPGAPGAISFTNVTTTSVRCAWSAGSSGGATIDQYQIGYGTSSTSPQLYESSSTDRVEDISNLTAGRIYYFWVRAHNSVGWGPWSARSSIATTPGSRVKVGTVYKNAQAYVRVNGVWKKAYPKVRRLGVWKSTN